MVRTAGKVGAVGAPSLILAQAYVLRVAIPRFIDIELAYHLAQRL